MQGEDVTPCCMMQRGELTPRNGNISAKIVDLTPPCIMQRRDLTSRCMMQREVKLQFKYLSDIKNKFEKNLYFEAGSKAGTFDIKKRRWKTSRYCPFHAAESFFSMSPNYYRFDSPLVYKADIFDYPLQISAARFDSLLHFCSFKFRLPTVWYSHWKVFRKFFI
jgi:hypothetical protein